MFEVFLIPLKAKVPLIGRDSRVNMSISDTIQIGIVELAGKNPGCPLPYSCNPHLTRQLSGSQEHCSADTNRAGRSPSW